MSGWRPIGYDRGTGCRSYFSGSIFGRLLNFFLYQYLASIMSKRTAAPVGWSKHHSLTLVATGIENSHEVGITRDTWTIVETHSLTLVATGIKHSNEVGLLWGIWTMA